MVECRRDVASLDECRRYSQDRTVKSVVKVWGNPRYNRFTGILTKADVLEASSYQAYSRSDAKRMMGAGFLDTLKSIGSSVLDFGLPIAKDVASKVIRSKLGVGRSGGAEMSGGMSGGAMSGGKLAKHMM